ncbi:MAG: CvpA family protein [Syntrophomonadaceae bacterium]|nr:CvpA family protein [Syntrophomonadaceae bacterium]
MSFHAVDCIILLLIAGGALAGFRKGFIKSVGAIISAVLGIFAAVYYWQPITEYLQKNYGVITFVAERCEKIIPITAFEDTGGMTSLLISSSLYAYQGLAFHIARLLVSALVFLVVLGVVSILLRMLWHFLSMIFGWGIMGGADRIGGMAFEAAKAILLLSIIVGLMMPLTRSFSATGIFISEEMLNTINTSTLLPYLESLFEVMGTIIGVRFGSIT